MKTSESRNIPDTPTVYRKLRNSTACHTFLHAFHEIIGLNIAFEPPFWKAPATPKGFDSRLAAPVRFAGELVGYLVTEALPTNHSLIPARRLLATYAERLSGLINYVLLDIDADVPESVALAISLLDFRENSAVSLCEAAERACMPCQNFDALFRHTTGLSFEEYVARHRLEKARRQLFIAEAASVSAAAESIGASKAELTNLFQRYLGESPESFRQRMQQNHREMINWPERPASSRPSRRLPAKKRQRRVRMSGPAIRKLSAVS